MNDFDIFNLQVFNEFNSRKPDEFNVFSGVTRNRLFMAIIVFTVLIQVMKIKRRKTWDCFFWIFISFIYCMQLCLLCCRF